MDVNRTLLKTSIKLVNLLDKAADEALPQEIADVVKLHSKLAVASSWIPVPGADVAAGAATIWGMYIRINNKIGLAVKDNVVKTIGSGVATNLAGYAATSGVASALKFIPGIGTIGGAIIMSATLYAITLASGYIYLQALTLLAEKSGGSLDTSQIGNAVKEVLKEKTVIKDFINEAKKSYKK
ncbi:MAG: hypothetical protein KBS99_07650 [Prevotellaceae bacterium]|nr:hypothetical protein [Candidatus Colivivens caballi]